METTSTTPPVLETQTGGSAPQASAPAAGAVDNQDYSVSPAIAAAHRGSWKWVTHEAERIRRDSKTAMGGGGATDLESQLANKIRSYYGESTFQNLNDKEILNAYRETFMPKVDPEAATAQLRKQFLPNYVEPKPPSILGMGWGLAHGFIDDFFEKPAFAIGEALTAIKTSGDISRDYNELARMRSAGVDENDETYKSVKARYDEDIARSHGATQVLGPALAGGAAAWLAGKFLKVGSRLPVVGGLLGAAEGAGGKLFAKALEASSGKTKWAIQHLAIPSIHTGMFMAEWEGLKDAFQGDFKDIPRDMWGGFLNGAMQGPAFHALHVGAGKAQQTWMDAFPNAATAAMQDGGAAMLEKFKYDTAGTIRDFKIDFRPVEGVTTEQSIRAQVSAMLDKLYGGGTASGTGTKLVNDLTAHLLDYAEKNPEVKLVPPTRDVRQMPGDPNPWKPTPAPAERQTGAAVPDKDLPDTVYDIDGKQKKISELAWTRLKKIYNEINEMNNPDLKEALYREIVKRKNGEIPPEEKITPPQSRTGTVNPEMVRTERDVPEGWGQSPLDVYFNPDQPMADFNKPEVAGGVQPVPRWRIEQAAAEEPLYGPRRATYRDLLANMARQLVQQIHADRNLPDPKVTRPHPGWGTAHIVEGEAAASELKAVVDNLNSTYGPQSAELVYDTGRAAGIRLNRELEAHFARGQTTPYIGWGTAGIKTTQESAVRTLTAMLKMLGMGDERVGVASPSGRVQMYTAEEYANELLEAAQHGARPGAVDPKVVESKQAEWLRNMHHEEAIKDDVARSHGEALQEEVDRSYDAAQREEIMRSHELALKENKARTPKPPKPGTAPRLTPAAEPPRPSGPHEAFILTIGEAKLNNKGFPVANVRMLLGKPFKVRMNKAGDAVQLGAPNHMLALPQLKSMLESADKHGVAIERIFNETPQFKSQIKALTDNGFKRVGNDNGATIFRRDPVPPGTVTQAEAASIPAATPTVVKRVVGKKPEQALNGAGNVVPGTPAVRPSPAGAQTNLFDPNK